MSTTMLQPQHFEAGMPVDPQAEAATLAWALSKPRCDGEPELTPTSSNFLGGGDMRDEYFREIAQERRSRQENDVEVARQER